MANTVTLLSYANTFGDWVVATNKLAQENNDLVANNYVKPTGTLFLNSSTLGLQVANNAVVQGQLQVSGIGSSAYIQKNLQVDGQVILTNTTTSLSTSGTISTSGVLYANSSANGVIVANNATVKGNIYGALVFSSGIELQANDRATLTSAQNYTDSANTFLKAYTDSANTFLQAYTDSANAFLQNYSTSGNTFLQTYIDSANTFLQSNDRTTLTLSQNYTDTANSFLRANDRTTLTLAQNYADSINTWTQSSIASSVTTGNVTASNVFVNTLLDGNNATAYINQLSVGVGGLSVVGSFTISGTTVYNTDTFTLNAGQSIAQNANFVNNRGVTGANAIIRWNEPSKYWDIRDVNNPTSYSQILTANLISDSTTSTSSSTMASSRAANTILSYLQGVSNTQNTNISSANTLASAAFGKANAEGTINNTQNTAIAAGNTYVWMASYTANAAWIGANTANGNISALQAQMNTTNTNITSVNSFTQAAFNTANTGGGASGNTIALQAQMTTTNTNITSVNTFTQAAFNSANAGVTLATAAYGKANAEGAINSTQNTWITNTNTKMEAAYAFANTRGTVTSVSGTGSANGLSLSGTVTSTGSITLGGSIPFPVSGSWFQGIPRVLNDGVMEVGRYIDFHNVNSGGTDYDVRMNCTGTDALTFDTAEITAASFNTTSDINKKENVQTVENSLEKILQMRGVSFEWKENKKKSIGVIAQEIEPIVPEIVRTDEDGIKTVSYDSIIGILIEAIKELKTEIDNLKGDNS